MNGSPDYSRKSRGRGFSVFLGIILLVIAVLAVLVGRGTIAMPKLFGSSNLTEVRAVIGLEKKEFFEDPKSLKPSPTTALKLTWTPQDLVGSPLMWT
ncbi:hypothetical protein [Corynebacterium glutamicum]|uniref:hypothetical protein n=1 Tax=Corynebacterium glutamicum TaxID=1718 RepID=UPI001E2EADD7|nr:hypothetical protein [Corynebacterium glutamicum]